LDRRAALLSVAARVAAVASIVAVAALLFVIMKPAPRQSVAAGSTPSDTTGSTSTAPPQPSQGDVEPKPAIAEFKALLAPPPDQPAPREQSQQLLRQFLQWGSKN
jgi:hypothetical protein